MKKQINRICGVIAILCGGLVASTSLTSPLEVGVPVSDAEASLISGGCSGVNAGFSCLGTCGSATIYSAGHTDDNMYPSCYAVCGNKAENGYYISSCYGSASCTGS